MKGRPLRISFDETTIRVVVLCVIVAFVDDKGMMQQRVMKVGLYDESPEEKLTNQMSDHIIYAIEEVLDVPRNMIKVFTRDGVYLNELCMMKLCGGVVIDPNTNKNINMRGIYPHALNIKCMSHTLDNCGADYTVRGVKHNRIEGPHAKIVYNQINGLFSGPGGGANRDWHRYTNSNVPSVSPTRWWSREEFWEYLMPFLKHGEEEGVLWFDEWVQQRIDKLKAEKKSVGAHMAKLEEIFVEETAGYDQSFLITAFIEIAVVVDVTKKVREATYIIEGDGPVSVMVLEILDAAERYYAVTYSELEYPNIRRHIERAVTLRVPPPGYRANAVVRVEGTPLPLQSPLPLPIEAVPEEACQEAPPIHTGDNLPLHDAEFEIATELEDAWKVYCLKISEPFMKYFTDMVMAHNCMPLWRAASMADPMNMKRKRVTSRDLRDNVEPLLGKLVSSALVDRMIAELSEYDRACSTIDWTDDTYEVRLQNILTFWASHRLLPAWTDYAHLVFLLQPTSACVERAFSIIKYIMGDQQVKSLRDKIEGSLMLRYNRGTK